MEASEEYLTQSASIGNPLLAQLKRPLVPNYLSDILSLARGNRRDGSGSLLPQDIYDLSVGTFDLIAPHGFDGQERAGNGSFVGDSARFPKKLPESTSGAVEQEPGRRRQLNVRREQRRQECVATRNR